MSVEPPPPAAPEAPPAAAAPPSPARRATWSALRPLVLRLHFYAGLIVAPFLLIAAVTGLLYAASYQIEKVVYDHELRVPAGERELPLAVQIAAAREAYPDGEVSGVRPAPEPGDTTRVLLAGAPGVPEDRSLAVFVNPHDGEVRGALEQYGSTGALPVRAWISELHRSLHLGETGRLYSELAASWLWVITGAGLVLWLARRRGRGKLRSATLPDRSATGRKRTMSLHASVGVWAAAGLFFLSATGLTWSTYAGESVTKLRESLGQLTPEVNAAVAGGAQAPAGDHAEHGGHGSHGANAQHAVGAAEALRIARAHGIGDPAEVTLPADASSGYVVKEVQRAWPVKQDAVTIHPESGKVTSSLPFADYPMLAKLTNWGIALHMGILFGLVNQIALAALMVALILLIVWGYRMWWQRGRDTAFGRPMPRGAWQAVPWYVLAPLAGATAMLGWYLPLLGIPLLAFLAADAAYGVYARRRRDTREAAAG
ncbi:PepSY domain-containing protein [Streptomyces sp. A7024]|uniref:PepSY domain-containing protein n=1 Tax=Streptomyces coryli TaxID=1128680 RepID=A0A6G4U057_9ACTN|nr:PepSY domain-containing protein [Streptomyces coryli]NGN64758.1 PepSY domain-containing protein [Streptomyces coryli]